MLGVNRILIRSGRVVLHTVVGGVLVVAGIVMLVTPGPGIVTIVLGLAVLAREFAWAERRQRELLDRIRDASTAARARIAARRAHHGGTPVDRAEPPRSGTGAPGDDTEQPGDDTGPPGDDLEPPERIRPAS